MTCYSRVRLDLDRFELVGGQAEEDPGVRPDEAVAGRHCAPVYTFLIATYRCHSLTTWRWMHSDAQSLVCRIGKCRKKFVLFTNKLPQSQRHGSGDLRGAAGKSRARCTEF